MSRILPLEISNAGYQADGQRLLDNISVTVDAGPLTMIVGPNGAGKSLLLRLCHGLISPESGQVKWHGSDPSNAAMHQAMVFQRPVVLRRSVMANVEYALKLRGVPARERRDRARDALERTGISALANRRADVLSGGEQQKLALARAWTLEPEVLFLDEPTASLDPASTRDVESLIGAIHEAGTKVIMTSHNIGQVRRLADEVIFLTAGQIVETGTTIDFLSAPRSEQARAYLAGELFV